MTLSEGRHAGLLVPLFSMPSSLSWGIGEILDIPFMTGWLAGARQDLLQLLPINEMAVGQRSPYSAMTAMAIDPILISVHAMEDFRTAGGEEAMGAAWRQQLADARASVEIDYTLSRALKETALRAAFEQFRAAHWDRGSARAGALRAWADEQSWWVTEYSLYRALHARHGDRAWTEWPEPLRLRDPQALEDARRELAGEILYRQWLQWIADGQWREAKERSQPVALLGDLPFMVDGDSADVWTHAGAFRLDASVGAPPDAFSEIGQNWGMPVYRWDVMAARGFDWLRDRARRTAALYDGYRIDHLVGFYRTYVFPRGNEKSYFTPSREEEQVRLGEEVLAVFRQAGARVIAEDLGTVPDFVRASLARLGVPGFKVFRWERHWSVNGQPYREPASYPPASVATSGTHDTDTMAAWWGGLDDAERQAVLRTGGVAERLPATGETGERFTPALRDVLLEALFASGSDFLLLPIQDLFGWPDRINVPGSLGTRNWTWRLPWLVDALPARPEARERAEVLRAWSDRYARGRTASLRP
jgi:4-alpha-glucanotransferase